MTISNERMLRQDGVFYHIYVPFFHDSNGDGIGDLKGITQKLDYLNDGKGGGLGIKGIWLSPIHPSPHYHKYSVLDYYAVAPEYGTIADLEELTREAAKRGIAILMDLIFNCTSDEHPAFIKACADPTSREAQMYWLDGCEDAKDLDRNVEWNTLKPWQKTKEGVSYIGLYSHIMPDLNFNSSVVRDECKKIAKFWLDKGVSGFRLDSAMHLFSIAEVEEGLSFHAKNVAWWSEFRDYCRSIRPDCFLVGEVWERPEIRGLYFRGLDSCFHFFLGEEIADCIHGKLSPKLLAKRLENAYLCAKLTDENYVDAPFLSNHDMARFADKYCRNDDELKLAAAIYLTLEGTPFVYFGEELGMRPEKDDYCPDYPPNDEFGRSRTAFDWGEETGMCSAQYRHGYLTKNLKDQASDSNSMYNFYRRLIHLRNTCRPIALGRWSPVASPDGILSYRLTYGTESVVLLHNLSMEPISLPSAYIGQNMIDLMDTKYRPLPIKRKRTLPPQHSVLVYLNKKTEDK